MASLANKRQTSSSSSSSTVRERAEGVDGGWDGGGGVG